MMNNLDISINNRRYSVSCDDGQEERLQELAKYVDSRVKMIKGSKSANDIQLIVLASLLLADEVADLKGGQVSQDSSDSSSSSESAALKQWTESIVTVIDQTTKRIETLAKDLEKR